MARVRDRPIKNLTLQKKPINRSGTAESADLRKFGLAMCMILHRTYLLGYRRLQWDLTIAFLRVSRGPQARWIRSPPYPHVSHHYSHKPKFKNRPWTYPTVAFLVGCAGYLAYQNNQLFRHTCLAVVRCSRVAGLCQVAVMVFVLMFVHRSCYSRSN
jgi:hypothetical protein